MKIYNEEIMGQMEEQNKKMRALQKDVTILNKTPAENAATMKVLRDPPESFTCGYQGEWHSQATIPYDSIF